MITPNSFYQIYGDVCRMFNVTLTETVKRVALEVYNSTGFNDEDLSLACMEYLKTNAEFAPKIGQLITIIKHFKGLDEQGLQQRARTYLAAIRENLSPYKAYIFSDAFAKQAFVDCFGSIKSFINRDTSDYAVTQNTKQYVERYVYIFDLGHIERSSDTSLIRLYCLGETRPEWIRNRKDLVLIGNETDITKKIVNSFAIRARSYEASLVRERNNRIEYEQNANYVLEELKSMRGANND